MNISSDVHSRLSLIIFILTFGICLPLCVFGTLLVYLKYKRQPFVTQRNVSLLITTHMAFSIYAFVYIPVEAVLMTKKRNDHNTRTVYLLIGQLLNDGLMLLIALRFWYSFLNIRKVQDSQQWRKQLDPQFKSWVLNHYKRLANPKLLATLYFSIYAVLIVIQAASYFLATFSKGLYVSMAIWIFFVLAFITMSITIFRYDDIVI
ncbi:hypothetical protein RFI_05710 [Reticulomyxa filosa]|uniref:Uncharacterized protein n=1 Tax=Reticulomyxa filosa TaxID=46433 RepID=X6P015_RETFI|nr:hypothetical protein RFI_05710 [Reticulomyxa filosa]|eukprot:ETO31409.1 hypothetical protein RFI_05710 [Reticulomyxa filosa]